MSEKEEALELSPLFVGMTRPSMIFGVTLDYFGVCIMVSLCGFILFSSPIYLVVYLPLHVGGVIACAYDHNIFRLWFKQLECLSVQNKKRWGCQSYEPF